MSNLVKQISPSESIFSQGFSSTTKQYSFASLYYLGDKYADFGTSTSVSMPGDKLNDQTLFEITKLRSFLQLPHNWDSYQAIAPSKIAVENSIDFVIRLGRRQLNPFYIVPSPNGDILVELKQDNVSLEFIFGEDGTNQIIGLLNNEEIFQKDLNETNESCSLKWLYCPDGDCFNW